MGFSLDADLNCCCGCCLGLAIGYLIFSETIFDEAAKESVGHVTESQADNFLLRQIDVYQRNIGPEIKEVMGVEKICRYDPTCSEYARVAIEKYGSLKGSAMAANRLLRCNPLSKGGDDPVV